MFDTIMGLPVHVLIIHVVVVLGPLTALLALAYAAMPARRRSLRWPLALGALATGISGFVAGQSGETLERRVSVSNAGNAAAMQLVHDHAEAGDLTKIITVVFMLIALAAVFALLKPHAVPTESTYAGSDGAHAARRSGPLALITAALLALAALGTIGSVIYTGHTGAKAAWADQISGPLPGGGG